METPLKPSWKVYLQWSDTKGTYQDVIYLDAETGELLARIGLLHDALYRKIYARAPKGDTAQLFAAARSLLANLGAA